MTMEEMLAEILAKLEEVDALLGIRAGPPIPSSPPSIPTHIAGSGEDQERGVRGFPQGIPFPNSTPSTAFATDAGPGFQSSVTKLPDPPVSIDGHLGIHFDADGGGIDRLSRLSDSLLRDIASRLPIKEAARTAVLSRRWSPIWCTAPFLSLSNVVNSPASTLVLANKDISLAIPIASSDDRECVLSMATNNLATAASASPTPSATPAPSEDTALDSQIGVTKLLVMAHARCSTPSPYQAADIPAMGLNANVMKLVTASSTPLRASSTSVLPLGSILDFPHTSTELGMVVLTMGSMRGSGCDTGVPLPANALDSNSSRDIVICLFDISKGAGNILATTTENVSVSEFMMLRSPWPPPAQAAVPGNGMLLRPAPWPLFNQDYARVQTAAVLSLWMVEVLEPKQPWPPPEQNLIMLQPCISCGLGWPNTGSSCFEAYWETHMCKLHWLRFPQSDAQIDEGNRSGAVDLFLSIFCQLWLFTEIPVAGMSMLLNGGFHLLTYFWMKYQISFPDLSPSQEKYRVISRLYKPSALATLMLVTSSTHPVLYKLLSGVSWEFEPWPPYIQRFCMHLVSSYAFQLEGNYSQLELSEGNLTHGHCNLLTYAIGCMVLATKMACGGIKSGWLIEQVNLWLLWNNMSAYQWYSPTGVQFMLVWLLPYKKTVDLISVASSKDTCSVCALLLIFSCTSSKKVDQSLMVLQVLHQLGIFIEFSDSVDTYWTPHDIKYAETVTRVQIQRICWQQQELKLLEVNENGTEDSEERQLRLLVSFQFSQHDLFVYLRTPITYMLSELWVTASLCNIHQSIIGQSTIPAVCIDLAEEVVRADRIAYLTLLLYTHIALRTKAADTIHIGSSLPPTVSDVQILEIVAYYPPCKGNRAVTQVPLKWAGLLVEISTWVNADQVPRKLTSTTAWGQAVFQGGENVTVQAADTREEPKS